MGLPQMIQTYVEGRRYQKLQKENEWGGLVPGDIIDHNGRKYMYRGINKNGGPGMPGFPEPFFGSARPSEPSSIFYLRRTGEDFPEHVFGESAPAAQAGNTGTIIGFLDSTRVSLTKVGHITPNEWKAMVDEMQQELKGQKPH